MKTRAISFKRGQNTAEYLIMLTLVAVASIGLFSVFGETLRTRVAYVVAAINGDAEDFDGAKQAGDESSAEAKRRAVEVEVDMAGQDASELKSGSGGN